MENNTKQKTCQLGILYLVIISFKDKNKKVFNYVKHKRIFTSLSYYKKY